MDEERLERELRGALRPVEPAPGARERIRQRLAAGPAEGSGAAGRRGRWLPWTAAAAAVLLAVSMATWGDNVWTYLGQESTRTTQLTPTDETTFPGLTPDRGPVETDVTAALREDELLAGLYLAVLHDGTPLVGHGHAVAVDWGQLWPSASSGPPFATTEPPALRRLELPEVTAAEALAQAHHHFGATADPAAEPFAHPRPGGYAVDVPGGTFYLLPDGSGAFQADGGPGVLGAVRLTGPAPVWEPAEAADRPTVDRARAWLSELGFAATELGADVQVRRLASGVTLRFQPQGVEPPLFSAAPAVYVSLNDAQILGARWLWPREAGVHLPDWLTREEVAALAADRRGYLATPLVQAAPAAVLEFHAVTGELGYAFTLAGDGTPLLVPVYRLQGQLRHGDDTEPAEAVLWLPAVRP